LKQTYTKGLVSVIIPTFERPNLTFEAVNSVLVQTYKNFEIIVVDDGSSEESFDKLKSLLANTKVTLLRINHSNHPGVVRNFGARNANGEWIAFLDSDDIWHREKLEVQIKKAKDFNKEAVASIGQLSSQTLQNDFSTNQKVGELTKLQLLKCNWIITSSVILKRDLYELVGGMGESYTVRGAEDYSTWLKVASHVDWYVLNQPLVIYSDQSPDSIRSSNPEFQNFAIALGWIDYLNWRTAQGKKLTLLTKIFLKSAPYIVWSASR
jgi:glycosyltransferase involved in cell wall biosynthesis